MKHAIICKCCDPCKTVMSVRPLLPDIGNPVPLVELEIIGNKKLYLDEMGIIDLYIKARNALNLQPVPDEVAENYDK